MTPEAFRPDDGFIALVAAAILAILADGLRIVAVIIEIKTAELIQFDFPGVALF